MHRFTYLTLLLGACSGSSSSSSATTQAEYDDSAQAIGSTTASNTGGGDVAAMGDVVVIASGTLPLGLALSANGHVDGSRLGVNVDYAIACTDAHGQALPLCGDPTDKVDATLAIDGNLATPGVDASLTRTGHWTVTGLQGDTATFAGTSRFDFGATVRSIFRPGDVSTYTFAYDANYDAVAYTTATKQTIGGSASFEVSGKHTVSGSTTSERTFGVHADLAFHADHTATLLLDGTQTYTVDLATGAVVHVSN